MCCLSEASSHFVVFVCVNYSMFFLVTRHSQVNLPLLSLLEKIRPETKSEDEAPPFDRLRDRIDYAIQQQATSDKRQATIFYFLLSHFSFIFCTFAPVF